MIRIQTEEEAFAHILITPYVGDNRMRIYLVEEKNVVRNTLQDFLTDLGHTVSVFDALDDLPDALDQHPDSVDLILTDLVPINGRLTALLRELHKRHPDIPFVLIPASNDVLLASEAIRCGVYAYLHRPIRLAELELMLLRLSEMRTNVSLQDERTEICQQPGFIPLAQQELRMTHRTETRLSLFVTDRNGTRSNTDRLVHRGRNRGSAELGAVVRETFQESAVWTG